MIICFSAGHPLTKAEVIQVVHVGEATLDKRVSEFTTTDEASLTAFEFRERIARDERDEAERIESLRDPLGQAPALMGPQQQGCQHVSKFCQHMLGICQNNGMPEHFQQLLCTQLRAEDMHQGQRYNWLCRLCMSSLRVMCIRRWSNDEIAEICRHKSIESSRGLIAKYLLTR